MHMRVQGSIAVAKCIHELVGCLYRKETSCIKVKSMAGSHQLVDKVVLMTITMTTL